MIDKGDEYKPRTGEWLIERQGSATLDRVRIDRAWSSAVYVVVWNERAGVYDVSNPQYLARDVVRFVQRIDA